MAVPGPNVPAAVAAGLICLALGVGAGAMGMTYYGYKFSPEKQPENQQQGEGAPAPPGRPIRPGGGPGMMGGQGMRGGGPGMMGAPNPKTQLATLVAKVDVLTRKPLSISLTEAQAKKLNEELKGLDAEELDDKVCQERFKAIMEVLSKDDKETLQAAGYRIPGSERSSRPPGDAPKNPFKTEENAKHLKSLQEKVEKTK